MAVVVALLFYHSHLFLKSRDPNLKEGTPMADLKVDTIIKGGFVKGIKNVIPVTINSILWVLTIWIPYLNVGTTIGISTLAIKMSKGTTISMVEIFDPIYRKRMGEYFLVIALTALGVIAGLVFIVIPGLVLSIAWGLSTLLVVGKELNPLEAMNESSKLTYGKNATIFFGYLLLLVIIAVVAIILGVIVWGLLGKATGNPGVAVLVAVVTFVVYELSISILIGAQATVYGTLVEGST